jgi:hypothetical protein
VNASVQLALQKIATAAALGAGLVLLPEEFMCGAHCLTGFSTRNGVLLGFTLLVGLKPGHA